MNNDGAALPLRKQIHSSLKMRILPQDLDANILHHMERKLKAKLEKKWSERHGYVENVELLPLTTAGVIDAKSGCTEFVVQYRATACKPHVGQRLVARVTHVTKLGVHFEAGPLQLFMHEKMIPASYIYTDGAYKCQRTGATLQRDGAEQHVTVIGTSWTDNCYVSVFSRGGSVLRLPCFFLKKHSPSLAQISIVKLINRQ